MKMFGVKFKDIHENINEDLYNFTSSLNILRVAKSRKHMQHARE
jgi:hypothetical protein